MRYRLTYVLPEPYKFGCKRQLVLTAESLLAALEMLRQLHPDASDVVCTDHWHPGAVERERQGLIALLVNLDPNGLWTDADSIAEGREPLTLKQAAAYVASMTTPEPAVEVL